MPLYHNNNENHFYFFRNKEMDALYVALALIRFAGSLAGVFVPIYFWELGMPLWEIFSFFLLTSVYFILFIFLLTPAIKKTHDKGLMLVSVPFIAFYYLGLDFISNYPVLFFILPAVHALSLLLFNTGYHTDFAGAADEGSLGKEIGARNLVTSLVNLSGPFLGGLVIASLGFRSVFLISTILLFFAVFPLFYFPKRNLSPDLSIKSTIKYLGMKKLMPFTVSGVGFATETIVGRIAWPIFIFLAVGSIEKFGGVISLGMLAASLVSLYMGFLSDSGKRRKIISWSGVVSSFVWLSRLVFTTPIGVTSTQIIGRVSGGSLGVSWSSQFYKIARAVSSPSSFILSREFLYHIVRIPFILFLIALSYYLPQDMFFKTSFVLAGFLTLLFLFANRVHTSALRNNQ